MNRLLTDRVTMTVRHMFVIASGAALLATACGSGSSIETAEPGGTVAITETSTTLAEGPALSPDDSDLPSRSYSLGFTPFPHDVSVEAVDAAYAVIGDDGDLFAFHTTSGVPWQEALDDTEFGGDVQSKWNRHDSETSAHPNHEVYLALTPLNDARDGMADNWGQNEHEPIPAAFAGLPLDSQQVKSAYTNFVLRSVEHYDPDYLAVGIEVNLYLKNRSDGWPSLVELLEHTTREVKLSHPDLPVFSTVTAPDLLTGWTGVDHQAQLSGLDQVLAMSDYLAISFYPFASSYLTEPVPGDVYDQLVALAEGKPLAIAETGYPAQTTELPSFGFTFEGTDQKQLDWITQTLEAADTHEMPFVVNFISRDYDALWTKIGGGDPLAVWRDTGLRDETGEARPALEYWQTQLARPRS